MILLSYLLCTFCLVVSTHGLPAIRNPSTIYTSRHLDASDRQFMRVYIPVMLLPTDEEYNALMRGRPAAQQFAQDFAVELTWYLERRGYDQERVWMRTKWQIGDFIRPSNPGGRVGFFIETKPQFVPENKFAGYLEQISRFLRDRGSTTTLVRHSDVQSFLGGPAQNTPGTNAEGRIRGEGSLPKKRGMIHGRKETSPQDSQNVPV